MSSRNLSEILETNQYTYLPSAKQFVVKFGTACFLVDRRKDQLGQEKINNAARILVLSFDIGRDLLAKSC
jgi:hypothetical protein